MRDEQELLTHPPSLIARHAITSPDRQRLRHTMRQRRVAVPADAQRIVAARIARYLRRYVLRKGMRIAIYAAFDGEIDLAPTVAVAHRLQCQLFAPRITEARTRAMEFMPLSPRKVQRRSRLGMLEPQNKLHQRINPRYLNLILIPVVAFDAYGWRLGFGGGYYDRKLTFKRRGSYRQPLLIGVGYEFQRVAPTTPAAWDVLLDAVVTETGWHRCQRQYFSPIETKT